MKIVHRLSFSNLMDRVMPWFRRWMPSLPAKSVTRYTSLPRWSADVSWGGHASHGARRAPLHAPKETVRVHSLDRARVLRAALPLEPDLRHRIKWYTNEPIAEFEGYTAEQVVQCGETDKLLDMLGAIAQGHRGT
ncbi:MAG: hypothetical protein ACREPQ_16620 [Rhodanobacter sp.]